jgi:hypothetical protein
MFEGSFSIEWEPRFVFVHPDKNPEENTASRRFDLIILLL